MYSSTFFGNHVVDFLYVKIFILRNSLEYEIIKKMIKLSLCIALNICFSILFGDFKTVVKSAKKLWDHGPL